MKSAALFSSMISSFLPILLLANKIPMDKDVVIELDSKSAEKELVSSNNDEKDCIMCPQVLPKCDCEDPYDCLYVKQTCTECSHFLCIGEESKTFESEDDDDKDCTNESDCHQSSSLAQSEDCYDEEGKKAPCEKDCENESECQQSSSGISEHENSPKKKDEELDE